MFHTGDLQSVISLAIAQQKLVGCFIRRDEDPVSRKWETEYFEEVVGENGETAGQLLGTRAVLLRLESGSREASFLSAFCPVDEVPMFIIIRNGTVLERIGSSVDKEEWLERVGQATAAGDSSAASPAPAPAPTPSAPPAPTQAEVQAQNQGATQAAPSTSTSTSAQVEASNQAGSSSQTTQPESRPQSSPSITDLFPNRAQQQEEEKKRREEAEKTARLARSAARRQEAEEAWAAHNKDKNNSSGQAPPSEAAEKAKARQDWLAQQKKRNEEAKRDRERILLQIEADKAERRARSEQKKAAQADETAASSPLPEASVAAMKRSMGAGGRCDLSIRLFNGSTIRGRFEPNATLGSAVRDWIKEETNDDYRSDRPPYTFREIRPPQASRSIELTEEQQTLTELGMLPTASLVLVPVEGFVDAYGANSGTRGAFGAVYNFFIWLWSLVMFFVSTPQAAANSNAANTPSEAFATGNDINDAGSSARSARIQVKTLADQRAEALKKEGKKAEFYNGNSSAFEGRKDDADDESKL